MSDFRVRVEEKLLSDRSPVYNVSLIDGREDKSVTFETISFDDAYAFATKLANAIIEHTNQTALVTMGGSQAA